MPITKSAKKALRQNAKKNSRNRQKKRKIKDLTKEVKILISKKENEKAKTLLPQLHKALDKAAKVKIIKKNTIARKKSRMTKLINKISK